MYCIAAIGFDVVTVSQPDVVGGIYSDYLFNKNNIQMFLLLIISQTFVYVNTMVYLLIIILKGQ